MTEKVLGGEHEQIVKDIQFTLEEPNLYEG